jgi:hypothetical protein
MPKTLKSSVPLPIEHRIHVVRGHRVMLDADLAALYDVETKMLDRAVRRNQERLPVEFMFQLTRQEAESLRYQTGTSKDGRGGRRYLPYVFTEHGVVMLSAVLNGPRAVRMSIAVVQAFVRLREMIAANRTLRPASRSWSANTMPQRPSSRCWWRRSMESPVR